MASRIVKSPSVQATAKRQFAAQAVATTERELVKAEPLKVSTLSNGLTVASLENHSPVSTIGVVIKAGSRNETYETAGVSHALRVASGLSTKRNTSFAICKNVQQVGGAISCTQGREHTLYAVQTTRDVADVGIEFLTDSVSNSMYKPWEVSATLPRLKLELATRTPATQALEMLHQAAFRSGLGNGLYCPSHMVGSHSTASLSQFTAKHFTAGRAALLGVGISHSALTKYAELLKLESGSGPSNVATKFTAAELRQETPGGMAYVALGAQTAGAVNVAEAMSNLLLQRILGSGPSVKYGVGSGLLSAAAASAGGNAAASGICQMYSDAGLVGALVVSEASCAGKAVSAVVSALRSVSVTDEQVAGAKNRLLADVYSVMENPLEMVEDMGVQLLVSGDVMPVEKYPEIIKAISTADVQAAAKKLAGSKLAMASVGNLSSVPYLDAL
eukprot:TRINITY_DN21814_c0_g1_i4.p1 TRINITY_DN21814_c0_g1~~TRINITY_DN21814_c0_g1_i4.p1  ORF type:complete len:446 (-),score=115.99 TRINITY_DN21814_c0_g1_i4:123-1460(-)